MSEIYPEDTEICSDCKQRFIPSEYGCPFCEEHREGDNRAPSGAQDCSECETRREPDSRGLCSFCGTPLTPQPQGDRAALVERLRAILDEDDHARRHGERSIITEERYRTINEAAQALSSPAQATERPAQGEAEPQEAEAWLRQIVNHWFEFESEHGLNELMDRADTWLRLSPYRRAERAEPVGARERIVALLSDWRYVLRTKPAVAVTPEEAADRILAALGAHAAQQGEG